jgi:hypothetical protein
MTTSSKRAGFALALVCLVSTPSCVTAALWDHPCGHHGGRWSGWDVTGRAVLTPITLAIDAVLITAVVCSQGCGHCCR